MRYFVFFIGTFVLFLQRSNVQSKSLYCPEPKRLPQFTIDVIEERDFRLSDTWQILYDGTPISDIQLTNFAGHDLTHEKARKDMMLRGREVFFGMLTGALGTAISSMGWVLYGQDQVSSTMSLSMALSGIVLSLAGTIFVSESIQVPLEPFIAPTPKHRFSRAEARQMVFEANQRLNHKICMAVQNSTE